MVQIIPAVLATNEVEYSQYLAKLGRCEALKDGWVHIDFLDGVFLPNKTIDAKESGKYLTTLQKEAHLMVQNPKNWIPDLKNTGYKKVFFHMEAGDDIGSCIDEIKKVGMEVGLVLKHETPIASLEPFVSRIDTVLLMSVVPGFQGQPFIEGSLDKIRQLKVKYPEIRAGVDGAVRDTNIKQIVESGIDFVVVGSFLLKGNIDENMEKLWEGING